jgi:hypothetical protein
MGTISFRIFDTQYYSKTFSNGSIGLSFQRSTKEGFQINCLTSVSVVLAGCPHPGAGAFDSFHVGRCSSPGPEANVGRTSLPSHSGKHYSLFCDGNIAIFENYNEINYVHTCKLCAVKQWYSQC